MDAVFILGMHRSGTSCLASCLEACGLYLGNVNRQPGSANNPYGTFESLKMSEINEALLGSWIRPRLPVRPRPEQLEAIARCAHELQEAAHAAGETRVGLKDPRLVLLLPFWRRHFERVTFVGTFRSAVAVEQSITARRELRARWRSKYSAWKVYNRALLALSDREPVELISFDLAAPEYLARIEQLCVSFGLSYDDQAVRRHFDPEVRHHLPRTAATDAEVVDIESRLAERAHAQTSCFSAFRAQATQWG